MAKYLIQHRRGTAEQWEQQNTIIPREGEIVIEIDEVNSLHKLKIGDGIHPYAELAYLRAGDEIVTQVLAEAKPRVVTVELTQNWERISDNKYSQVVSLEGITNHSRLDLQPNADMIAEFKQLGLAFVTENNNGVITVYSVGNAPQKAYSVQATIVETKCESSDAPIVGIPIEVSASTDYVGNNFANALKETVVEANVVLNNVSPMEHDVIITCHSKNLIDKSTATLSVGLSTSTGGTYPDSNLFSTDFIPVDERETYVINWSTRKWACGYDSDKKFVAAITISNEGVCVIPDGVSYVRICVSLAEINTIQFEYGMSPTDYAEYEPQATIKVSDKTYTLNVHETIKIKSVAPTMTIESTTANVVIKAEYNKDIQATINDVETSVTESVARDISISQNIKTGETILSNLPFEIGNVEMVAGYGEESAMWKYNVSWSRTSRVRTKQGITLKLNAGDVIGLNDYSDARFAVGYRGVCNNVYFSPGWSTSEFTVPFDGDYIILISNLTEKTQTNARDLGDLVFIRKYSNQISSMARTRYDAPYKFKSVNHRGYSEVAPENTLPAYRLSKKNGFDYAECDIRWTSDGVPVLLHDETINRTGRNADGTAIASTINIADITYEEALSYDFGAWKSSEYAGTKIPTLKEFMILCRNIRIHPYLEIEGELTAEQARTLFDIVDGCGMANDVTWVSFVGSSLKKIVDIDKYARCGYNILSVPDSPNHFVAAGELKTPYNEVFVNIQYNLLTDEAIDMWRLGGFPVEAWCPTLPEEIVALNPYISGVCTDKLKADECLYNASID